MDRRGNLADRFHEHLLRSPTEVAKAVDYVVGNFWVHALRRGGHQRFPRRREAALGAGQFKSAWTHDTAACRAALKLVP